MQGEAVTVTGGCLCGRIRYGARVFLEGGCYCHCRICQKSTGQPAEITVPIESGSLTFSRGEPTYYASSAHGERGFCGHCGSRLLWRATNPDDDWLTNVTVGSLDDSAKARPTMHIHVDARVPWYDVDPTLPTYREEDTDTVLGVWMRERNRDT